MPYMTIEAMRQQCRVDQIARTDIEAGAKAGVGVLNLSGRVEARSRCQDKASEHPPCSLDCTPHSKHSNEVPDFSLSRPRP